MLNFSSIFQVQRNNKSISLFFIFRQQKPFYQQCLKKTMVILWQLLRWPATLVLQNWLTTVPVNLQRLVSMRHCVWSSNYLVVTCKPHAFAHISFNQPACLMMSIQGKFYTQHKHTFILLMLIEGSAIHTTINFITVFLLNYFFHLDGCPHWHPKMLLIVSFMPFNIRKNLQSYHAIYNWCFVSNGKMKRCFVKKNKRLTPFLVTRLIYITL